MQRIDPSKAIEKKRPGLGAKAVPQEAGAVAIAEDEAAEDEEQIDKAVAAFLKAGKKMEIIP